MYEAIICKITNLKPIPNADSIVTGKASGFDVVVGANIEEGTLGIYFPCDGQISEEFAKANNLYRHEFLNADPKAKAGFFEDNRRVKAIRLRKCKSEGWWATLDLLNYTGVNVNNLKAGDLITEIKGHKICNKYFTKATRNKISKNQGKTSKKSLLKASFPDFKEHKDTSKLRMMIDFIPEDAILNFTEKVHGTSGRTGRHYQMKKYTAWHKFINFLRPCTYPDGILRYVSGSRKVVIDTEHPDVGFYEGTNFRSICHNQIIRNELYPGETVYYEIVGYDDQGGAIMGSQVIEDKKLKKVYGDMMTYSYGCSNEELEGKYNGYVTPFRVLVYRITQRIGSEVIELSFEQLKARTKELELEMVPQLRKPLVYNGDKEALMELCEELSQGHSTLDDKHIREGVVVRVEKEDIDCNYKYKSFHFCELEGIQKNSDDYVDPEEIA